MSWLSDFGNESEYLFLDNGYSEGLRVCNIVNTQNGMQYDIILKSFAFMNRILFDTGKKTNAEKRNVLYYHSPMNAIKLAENINMLICEIIKTMQDNTISIFDEYAINMCRQYFQDKRYVTIFTEN
eukprot:313356_1